MARKCLSHKTFLLIIALLLVSPIVFCQEETDPKKAADDPKKGLFEDLEKKAKRLKEEIIKNPALADPELLVAVYSDDLCHWPRFDQGKEAVSKILQGGDDVINFLLPILDGRDYRKKPAVAHILAELGFKEAKPKIEALLTDRHLKNDPKYKGSVRQIIQSLYLLDPVNTKKLCIENLDAKEKLMRQAAFSILTGNITPAEVDVLVKFLESNNKDVRQKAFLLLQENPSEKVDDAALVLIGDNHPQLAQDVCNYLVSRSSDSLHTKLAEMISFEPDRNLAFVLTVLTNIENIYSIELLKDDYRADLEKLMEYREPLVKVSAAAALGNICHRSGTDIDKNLIHNKIVPTMMEVFLPNLYFKDHSCMLDLAAESMKKLANDNLFDRDLSYWREWWKTEGPKFTERQYLLTVTPAQYKRARIAFKNPASAESAVQFEVCGSDLVFDPVANMTIQYYFISDQDMGEVVDSIFTAGFFTRKSESLDDSEIPEDAATIEMTVEGCSRLIISQGEEDTLFTTIENMLLNVRHSNAWQLLYSGGDRKAWWDVRYNLWKEEVDEKILTDRFIDELTGSFEVLPNEVILECLAWLKKRDKISESLDEKKVFKLLTPLKKIWTIGPVVEELVALISENGEKKLFETIFRFMFRQYEEKSYPLMAKVMVDLNCIEDGFKDSRSFVRIIAAKAVLLTRKDLLPQLKELVRDENLNVRIEALCSLVAKAPDESSELFNDVMAIANEETRTKLLKALIQHDFPWTLDVYKDVLSCDSPALWLLAFEGLSKHRSKNAVSLAVDFIEARGIQSDSSGMGIQALEKMGGESAREALLLFLEKCKDKKVGNEIILALAELGETRVLPGLEDCLLDSSIRKKALDYMALLLVSDFGRESWKYRELWQKYKGENQAFFLKMALGYTGAEGNQEKSYCGIPLSTLVDALANKSWQVRLAAIRILEEGAGQNFGKMTKEMDAEGTAKIAEAWGEWLSKG